MFSVLDTITDTATKWLRSTTGALHVKVVDLIFPAQWFVDGIDGAAGAADNDVLYSPTDVSMYNYHVIENNSAVAINVFGSLNGTYDANQAAIAVELDDDVTAGKTGSLTIPANKRGVIKGKTYKSIEVRQAAAGTIAAGAVVVSHGAV